MQRAPGRVWTWPTSQANSLPELAARPKDLLLNAMTSVVLTCSPRAAREVPYTDAASFLPKNLKSRNYKTPTLCLQIPLRAAGLAQLGQYTESTPEAFRFPYARALADLPLPTLQQLPTVLLDMAERSCAENQRVP